MRILVFIAVPALLAVGQDLGAGRILFEDRCARCHGGDAKGGDLGPPIADKLQSHANAELRAIIRQGLPARGMPPIKVAETDLRPLILYLRSLQPEKPAPKIQVQLTDGRTLEGEFLNQGFDDLQLRGADRKIHLLRKASGERFREVTSETNWPEYNGDRGGNRYTTMTQITPASVNRLAPKWVFNLPGGSGLEVTPVVVDGVMYVTNQNECFALDAGTGRQIWHYRRAKTAGLPMQGINRGVAAAGDKIFMHTDHAHMIALDRSNGELLWDTEMADYRQSYFSTSAPLTAGNLVIGGVGGGEHGSRGFVAAFDQTTGKEAWRFWTIPKPGEPAAETWKGKGIAHGGAPTWFTGTYDSELDTVFWPTGNPAAEYNGDDRIGDNLYSDCILALDAKTGKLKWHFQTTPHDLWDWDATETPMVVNADWQGSPRKLLLQANRNGFFYVWDRTNGKMLLAQPFVRNLNWASAIGAEGRPIVNPKHEPEAGGTRVCPSQDGATNWFSPSYNPATGLYYIQTFEKCSDYSKRDPGIWAPGKEYLGGSQRTVQDDANARILKAIDVRTGKVVWELPQPGPANTWGGTLATSTGLVIFCEEGGALMAADATTGKPLWSFQTNSGWKASPMTYMFDGKQYIAVAAGPNVLAFGLLE
jgi:alcohol dehydrogenase (cytochrome c)